MRQLVSCLISSRSVNLTSMTKNFAKGRKCTKTGRIFGERFMTNLKTTYLHIRSDSPSNFRSYKTIENDSKSKKLKPILTESVWLVGLAWCRVLKVAILNTIDENEPSIKEKRTECYSEHDKIFLLHYNACRRWSLDLIDGIALSEQHFTCHKQIPKS